MKLLADENVEAATVDWLRQIGHDVCWAVEELASTPDADVLDVANASSRVLLTRDTDFGHLVFVEQRISEGIVLVRIAARNQWHRLPVFQKWWPEIEMKARGHFLVVTNDRIRVRQLRSET